MSSGSIVSIEVIVTPYPPGDKLLMREHQFTFWAVSYHKNEGQYSSVWGFDAMFFVGGTSDGLLQGRALDYYTRQLRLHIELHNIGFHFRS